MTGKDSKERHLPEEEMTAKGGGSRCRRCKRTESKEEADGRSFSRQQALVADRSPEFIEVLPEGGWIMSESRRAGGAAL